MQFEIYKRRYLFPDKKVGKGFLTEAEFGGNARFTIWHNNDNVTQEEYNVGNCITLKNPQTLTRIARQCYSLFGNDCYIKIIL